MVRSDLRDYDDAYILFRGRTNVRASSNTDRDQKDS